MTKARTPEPPIAYMLTPRGRRRMGDTVQYGTISPIVREAIDREGVVKPSEFAKARGLSLFGVQASCKREVESGRAVHMFAAFWHPELAATVQRAMGERRGTKLSEDAPGMPEP